jgi:hypothetical protein
MVRRAAAYLLNQMFQGVGYDLPSLLPKHLVRATARALRVARQRDADAVTRFHAQAACDLVEGVLAERLRPDAVASSSEEQDAVDTGALRLIQKML